MNLKKLSTALYQTIKHGTTKSVGIEVTKKCNLRCKHCYRRDFNGKDLSIKEWTKIFKKLKSQGYIQAGWVGGEPLLRQDLIKEGKKYFPINAVVTNGTIPLPDWQNTLFGVSVDGTPEIYKEIRGEFIKDQYKLVEKNILQGIKKGNNVLVLMTIHKINKHCLEEFVENWHQKGVTGVIFDFYTPQIDESKDTIWLSWTERDKVLDRILKLREKYKDFLPWNTPKMIKKMRSTNCQKYTNQCRKNALKENPNSLKLNYKGKRLYPCIMGSENLKDAKIDCNRCGCIFAFPPDTQALLTSIKVAF